MNISKETKVLSKRITSTFKIFCQSFLCGNSSPVTTFWEIDLWRLHIMSWLSVFTPLIKCKVMRLKIFNLTDLHERVDVPCISTSGCFSPWIRLWLYCQRATLRPSDSLPSRSSNPRGQTIPDHRKHLQTQQKTSKRGLKNWICSLMNNIEPVHFWGQMELLCSLTVEEVRTNLCVVFLGSCQWDVCGQVFWCQVRDLRERKGSLRRWELLRSKDRTPGNSSSTRWRSRT